MWCRVYRQCTGFRVGFEELGFGELEPGFGGSIISWGMVRGSE